MFTAAKNRLVEARPTRTGLARLVARGVHRRPVVVLPVAALFLVLALALPAGAQTEDPDTVPDTEVSAVESDSDGDSLVRVEAEGASLIGQDPEGFGNERSASTGFAIGDDEADTGGAVSIDIGSPGDEPSQTVLVIVGLSLLSLAPSLVVMLTSFTRIVVLLSMTRNALGLQGVPPNQVVIGLSLFLSLFVMAPTLTEVNDKALQPYLEGSIDQGEAYERATGPMESFMLANTRPAELDIMMDATPGGRPATIDDVGLTTIIPAFVLSELKTAFLMGFVIFIPFLIIDLVVASVLMSLGMMMLPPVFVSLPFKLLLFVLVGGWSLIVEMLLASYV